MLYEGSFRGVVTSLKSHENLVARKKKQKPEFVLLLSSENRKIKN